MVKSKILLFGEKCTLTDVELSKRIGRPAAQLFNKILYWINNQKTEGKDHNGQKWIYNTLEDWADQLGYSTSTIKNSIRKLKDLNLILVEKLSSFKSNRTNFYTINYEALHNFLPEIKKGFKTQNTLQDSSNTQDFPSVSRSKNNQSSDKNCPMIIQNKTNTNDLINPIESNKSGNGGKGKVIEKSIPHQMAELWNNIINPEVKISLTKERCRYLKAALKHKFKDNLQEWKTYCQQIASSDYLMGKIKSGFKATIDWVLKFDIIQRIQERQFGVKFIKNNSEQIEDGLKSLSHYSPQERTFRRKLMEKIGVSTYKAWFEKAKVIISDTTIEFVTLSSFQRDWIKNNFSQDLERLTSTQVVIR